MKNYINCPKCLRPLTTSENGKCPYCGHKLFKSKSTGMPDIKRRSVTQERKLAKERGGKVQPGSGCSPLNKGDVKEEGYLYECKTTTKKSFSLKQSILHKLRDEAGAEKIPVIQIEFSDDQSSRSQRYAILQWKDFRYLTDSLQGSKD